MQAIYAWYCTDYQPAKTFEYNLEEFADEIRSHEQQKGDKGDLRLLTDLFYGTIERQEEFDQMIQRKAENWELERIALLDRILMQMGICEMLSFAEIPIKVTINEYLEIAKKFSTPKSSKFINGILDSLFIEMKDLGNIEKRGRGLIEESIPKRGMDQNRRPRFDRNDDFRGRPGPDRYRNDGPPPERFGDQRGPDRFDGDRRGPGRDQDRPPIERSGSGRPRISRNTGDRPQFDRPRPQFDRDRPQFDRDRDQDRPPADRERKRPILNLNRDKNRGDHVPNDRFDRDRRREERMAPNFDKEENKETPVEAVTPVEETAPVEVTPPTPEQPSMDATGAEAGSNPPVVSDQEE